MTVDLDQYFPLESIYLYLAGQWSIYTVILAYKWSVYGLKKVKF